MTENFPKLLSVSPSLSSDTHMHTLPTQTLTKAFNPHNSTPPFFSVWVERGRAMVTMVMHLLLRLICAGHLSGLTECVCVRVCVCVCACVWRGESEGARAGCLLSNREVTFVSAQRWDAASDWILGTTEDPKALQYFSYDKLHIKSCCVSNFCSSHHTLHTVTL